MIVRELVTKLGFQFDRTQLDKFEKAISGFKSKVAVAAGLIAGLIAKVFDFSTAVVQTKDMADYAGIALEEFKALQLAASKFAIDENVFTTFFKNTSLAIKEASRGVNSFVLQLTKESQGVVNFRDLNGQLKTTKELIFDISAYIKSIPDRSEQLRILGNIPGIGLENAGNFLRFLELSNTEIEKLIANEEQAAKEFASLTKPAQEFNLQVAELSTEFQKFAQSLLTYVVPILSQVFKGLNAIINSIKDFGGGVRGFVEASAYATGLAIEDLVGSVTGHENSYLKNLKREQEEEDRIFQQRVKEHQANISNSSQITNNNNFDINVPPGTTEEQSINIAEALNLTMNSFWDEKLREAFNNSPQVE